MEDEGVKMKDERPICVGKGVCLREGKDMAVLSIGAIGNTVAEAIDLLEEGLRIKDKRQNSFDYEDSETKVIRPSSCVLHP